MIPNNNLPRVPSIRLRAPSISPNALSVITFRYQYTSLSQYNVEFTTYNNILTEGHLTSVIDD